MYQDRLYQLGNNIRDWLLCWKVDFSLTKFQLFPLKGYRTETSIGEYEDVYKEEFDRHASFKLLSFDEFQMSPLYFADPVDMEMSIFRSNILTEDKANIIRDDSECTEYWEIKTQKREKLIEMLKTLFKQRYKSRVDHFVKLIQHEQQSLDSFKEMAVGWKDTDYLGTLYNEKIEHCSSRLAKLVAEKEKVVMEYYDREEYLDKLYGDDLLGEIDIEEVSI